MFCLTKSENKKNKDICIAVTGGDKMADQKIDMTQDLKNCCHFIKILCVSVTESHHHKLLWWQKKCILQWNMQLLLQMPSVREKGSNTLSVCSRLPLVTTVNELLITRGNIWSMQIPLMALPAAECWHCFPFDHIVPFLVCPQHCSSYRYSVFQAINNISFNICTMKHSSFTYIFFQNMILLYYHLLDREQIRCRYQHRWQTLWQIDKSLLPEQEQFFR